MEPVTELSSSIFEPHVGEGFEIVGRDGRRVTAVLERIADRGGAPHSTMFSLYFLVPPGGPTAQGSYHLERDGFGAVELFLVPVQQEGDSLRFEAAMNLLGSERK